MSSTEPLFFDTDGISAFLWVNKESLLCKLYPGRIIIPEPVYAELSNPCIPHLKQKTDIMLNAKLAELRIIEVGSVEYALFHEMTASPRRGHTVIGRGEAAAIALAKQCNGILESNALQGFSFSLRFKQISLQR